MPWALTYGVPYELFWHLNPKKIEPYKKAYENKLDNQNQIAWLNGLYVTRAVASCFSKNEEYPKTPIDFNERTNEDGEILTDADLFEMYAIKLNQGMSE